MLLLVLFFSFNKAVAQNKSVSFTISGWNAAGEETVSGHAVADSTKLSLQVGKGNRPLVSFLANLTKTPGLNFTVRDTTGAVKLQSLLQVVNDDLIQWQWIDQTTPSRPSSGKGEIRVTHRKQ
jgi:hypothetical protein